MRKRTLLLAATLTSGATLPQPSTLAEWGGFASGAAVGDFNGDGKNDVTLTGQNRTRLYKGPFTRTGAPASHNSISEVGSTYDVIAGENGGEGAVWLSRTTATGTTATGSKSFNGMTLGGPSGDAYFGNVFAG